ncbi:transposase [Streptomyces sp. NPDC127084]|uniref:transposase n=1 Tax=Streptomyces sp. NPDC127084 TaxID=3347133 RepID=UPI0036465BA2
MGRYRLTWPRCTARTCPSRPSFLSFDVEIRKVICSTNAIESVNARIRAMLRTCGSVPGWHAKGVPSRMICKVSE